jgi:GAF domain-containing protein
MSETRRADGVGREAAIVETFVRLADTLVDTYDVIDFLQYLCERCVELIGIDQAGVLLAAPTGNLQAVAASSEQTRLLELFEVQNSDGPCLDSFRSGEEVFAGDLEQARDRWPMFANQALHYGFQAVHSVPLRLRQQVIGALNLLIGQPAPLSDLDGALARALADIATIGVLQQRSTSEAHESVSGLQRALTSRIRIEQAKGILAERSGSGVDEAFEVLRSYARRHQTGITAVAEQVVRRELDIISPTD